MLFGRNIVELNATNNTLVRSYAWGPVLSGSLSGAGGVGGFAWVTLHTTTGPASGTHFTCYDGNGNIVALVSATTGDVTARYEYGPFGEPIRISGPAASLNHFRFSTKRMDSTTDLVLFEYWAYRPTTGRWPNRDPLDEQGGRNLYGFNYNNTIQFYDPDGRNPAVIVIGGVTVAVGECVLLAVITCMATPPCRDALIDLVRSGVRELADCIGECSPKRKWCRPCIPPVGTTAGEVQTGHDHWPITGPHIHFFEMHQDPIGRPPPGEKCRCFWKRVALPPVPGTTLPPGVPPVGPSAGGGIEYY
jgi:RHS repeat-associated protein